MPTFYSRNYMSIADETRDQLRQENRIAIHYPSLAPDQALPDADTQSLDPAQYQNTKARSVMNMLCGLAHQGGYVCAEYQGWPMRLVGWVEPNGQPEIFLGQWQNMPGREAVLKSVQMVHTIEIDPADHAFILVGRPRQGTLQQWRWAGNRIQSLVDQVPIPRELESLLPAQQEVMCCEFLLSEMAEVNGLPRLRHLLLPVGRTMEDIDILGITDDGHRIYAQVTYLEQEGANDKIDRLGAYAGPNRHLLMFCRADQQNVQNGVTIFPLQQVFAQFTNAPTGRIWLNIALDQTQG